MFNQVLASWRSTKLMAVAPAPKHEMAGGHPGGASLPQPCPLPRVAVLRWSLGQDGAVTAHLQGVALLQPQFRFVVVHSLAVVLHVPQSGSQGHVDDGQLGPWPVEQLRKVQLGGQPP